MSAPDLLRFYSLDTRELDTVAAKEIRDAIDYCSYLATESAEEIWAEWVEDDDIDRIMMSRAALRGFVAESVDSYFWRARGPLRQALIDGLATKLQEFIEETGAA